MNAVLIVFVLLLRRLRDKDKNFDTHTRAGVHVKLQKKVR